MRIVELTAPKSTVDVQADVLKRQKKDLADRTQANKVKKAEQALSKQQQKLIKRRGK